MTKTFNESDVTIETLDAHLRGSGVMPYDVQPDRIKMRTEQGIGYRISIITDRKFIRFPTYLPLNRQASIGLKLGLARRLNDEVFLPVFTVDSEGDLSVAYVMPYAHGLIAGNFVAMVTRYASLLEFVVERYNSDGLIDFGAPSAVVVVADVESAPTGGKLLH